MEINVNFFGLAIREGYGQYCGWHELHDTEEGYLKANPDALNPGALKWSYGPVKKVQKIYKFYFVLDLGAGTSRPICFWEKEYVNPKMIEQVIAIAGNAGLALLNTTRNAKKQPVAIDVMSKLKVKMFGNLPMPIKRLTSEEFKERYSCCRTEIQNFQEKI